MQFLETKGLTKTFGGLVALSDINIVVQPGEIRGIIGPNGAGKSTLFNLISGMLRPSKGEVFFKGENVTGKAMDRTAAKGLARTFQANILFEHLSVLENVLIGCHLHASIGFRHPIAALSYKRKGKTQEQAQDIIKLVGLDEHRSELARSLPHGPRRRLGIAIAVATKPELLMLDEPVGGMNSQETNEVMDLIQRLRDNGLTIMLVEHNMKAVMGYCDKITVISEGHVIAEDIPQQVAQDKTVIEAYLGAEENAS